MYLSFQVHLWTLGLRLCTLDFGILPMYLSFQVHLWSSVLWMLEEYYSGDNVPALQVNCPNPKTFKTHLHTEDSPSRYPHHHQPHCQHHPNLWYCVQGHRRRHHPPHQPAQLATGSTTALQTTPINEMLSFYFSKKLLSISRFETRTRIFFFKSQSSRRERDFFLNISGFETRARFFSQHLRVRDESEIFSLNISGFETRVRYFLSKSHVSRWERDMQTNFLRSSEKNWTLFSREFPGSRILAMLCKWPTIICLIL